MGSFSEMILQELIPMFDESDLELLIGGLSEIYMDDWTKLTDYRGHEKTDQVIEFCHYRSPRSRSWCPCTCRACDQLP